MPGIAGINRWDGVGKCRETYAGKLQRIMQGNARIKPGNARIMPGKKPGLQNARIMLGNARTLPGESRMIAIYKLSHSL